MRDTNDNLIYKVYSLREPDSDKIRYIGITKGTLHRRLKRHLYDVRINHRTCWIKKLKNKNEIPIIELIHENINQEEALLYEKKYILLFKSFGAKLVNSNDGGVLGNVKKGIKRTKEQIEKSVKKRIENGSYAKTQEQKDYMSDKMKGRKPKNFESFIGNRKGAKLTDEQKNRLRDFNLGKRRVTKIIEQYDLLGNYINTFQSILQASRDVGISTTSIRGSLNKKVKPRKYEFRYKTN